MGGVEEEFQVRVRVPGTWLECRPGILLLASAQIFLHRVSDGGSAYLVRLDMLIKLIYI